MANIPTKTREEIVDLVEEMYMTGFIKPHQIWKAFKENNIAVDIKTIRNYVSIVQRRIRKKYRTIDLSRILKKELRSLDFMERRAWINYQKSYDGPEKSSAINSIIKIKERRAKLLGLDSETLLLGKKEKTLEDLLREDDEKEEQTIDRGIILDSGQARQPGEIQIESSAKQIGSGGDAEGSDIKTEAKGS